MSEDGNREGRICVDRRIVCRQRYWQRTDLELEQRRLFEKLGFDVPPKRFTTHIDAVSELTSRM